MIVVQNCLQEYPSKSIIEDLVFRDGPATEESYTPFNGKKKYVEGQFSGSQKLRFDWGNFERFIETMEFDPTKTKGKKKVETEQVELDVPLMEDLEEDIFEKPQFQGLQEAEATESYKYLEDLLLKADDGTVTESYLVEQWVKWTCIGFKHRKDSNYKVVQNKSYMFPDEETGEYVPEKELQIDTSNMLDLDLEDYQRHVNKLPYLIKTIWALGEDQKLKCNLFTFMPVYVRYKRKGAAAGLTRHAWKTCRCYKPERWTDSTRPIKYNHEDDIKGEFYTRGMDIFIKREEPYISVIDEFLDILEYLGIDFLMEDVWGTFTEKFVRSLRNYYLPTNKEYFEAEKTIDVEVMAAISKKNLLTLSKSDLYIPNVVDEMNPSQVSPLANVDIISHQYGLLLDDYNRHKYNGNDMHIVAPYYELNKDAAAYTMACLNALAHAYGLKSKLEPIDVSKISISKDGIVYYMRRPFIAPGDFLGELNKKTKYDVIVTQSGAILPLMGDLINVIHAISCKSLVDYYNAILSNNPYASKPEWGKLLSGDI